MSNTIDRIAMIRDMQDYSETGFDQNADDIAAAGERLREEMNGESIWTDTEFANPDEDLTPSLSAVAQSADKDRATGVDDSDHTDLFNS